MCEHRVCNVRSIVVASACLVVGMLLALSVFSWCITVAVIKRFGIPTVNNVLVTVLMLLWSGCVNMDKLSDK